MNCYIEKKDGQFIFDDVQCDGERNKSTFWCIQEADKIYKWPDFPKVGICTNDWREDNNTLGYAGGTTFSNLIPDFCFHKHVGALDKDYDEIIYSVSEAGKTKPEIHKVGWIGKYSHDYRKYMVELGNANPELFDFTMMWWGDDYKTPDKFITHDDLVKKYAVVIDIEGYGYSGRVKYLLFSRRPLILIDRENKEWYYEHLIPWRHYIPVKRDMSDLVEKTKWCLDNYEAAKLIANDAYDFASINLTRKGCYARWNEVLNLKPKNA